MPGIHVRSLGKLDWVERGNEPVLTIPGAYWLCHKKHIYKFTFKWHKSLRNTEGFAYPKELTKVIRRIIKSQPRQGQQFGTRHLLVTYNHSPWMRQDKMFAMLKFRSRTDATAFPHAFVLTVQTLNDSSTDELHRVEQDKGCSNGNTGKAKNGRMMITKEANKGATANYSPEHQTHSYDRPVLETNDKIEDFGKIASSDKSGAKTTNCSSRESESERKKDSGKRGTMLKKIPGNIEADLPRIKRRNRRGHTGHEKSKNKLPPDSPAEKGIAADFADLPYQYIIEKEIEDSKGSPEKACPNTTERESCPGPSHKESDLPGKSLPRSPRAAQAESARSADITDLVMEGLMFTIRQDQDTVTVVEQKTKLEMDEVLENSEKAETKEGEKCLLNSSLLRLENLITKIEMSEAKSKYNEDTGWSTRAIPNEKIIAKSFGYNSFGNGISSEHGICSTRYDSITPRIESPRKSKNSPRHSQSIVRSPISEMPKFPLVKINLNNVRDVLSDTLRYDYRAKAPEIMEPGDEEMEIDLKIALRGKEDEMKNCEMEDEEEDEVGLELKYEEKDDCESDKADKENGEQDEEDIISETLEPRQREKCITDEFGTKIGSKLSAPTTPTKDHLKTAKCAPRVVSNEIVTVDQIPLGMQKALSYKRFKRTRLSNDGENFDRDTAASPTDEYATTDDYESEIKLTVSPLADQASELDKSNEKLANTAPSPTIDITKEFQRELTSEKSRKQPIRRKSLRHAEQGSTNMIQAFTEEPEIRLDMWKFMQDITRGAKVVVRRLDLANIPNGIPSGSSLSKYNAIQRYATES